MPRRRALVLVLTPLVTISILIASSWIVSKDLWYFRGYEYYSDWVYPGLASPNTVMNESGDSAREFLFDSVSKRNRITLNQYGDRSIPCLHPTVIGLGDSQMFGSGLDDQETFPYFVYKHGGPCIYNAGRHSILEALRNPAIRTNSVLVTSTERDGFTWYCEVSPSKWDLSVLPSENFILKQEFSLRVAFKTAFNRTVNVLHTKIQNLLALRVFAPKSRLIKYQHTFQQEDLFKNMECLNEMNHRFISEGIHATYLLFPAAQTLYPTDAKKSVDDFTLSFITSLSELAKSNGIQVLDSRKCLEVSAKNMNQLHDTHLSSEGMDRLATCYVKSLG